jgi:hypothetical protein
MSVSEERRRWLGDELDRLEAEHRASEGNRVVTRISAFQNSYHVFIGNHRELKRFLAYIAEPMVAASLWEETNRERIVQARWEALRLFHNYVASALSLVDVTRRFMAKNYAGTAFLDEYQARIRNTFDEAPLHRFVQGLRVYSLHRRLPAMRVAMHLKRREDGGADLDNYFELYVDELKKWKKWPSAAKRYLATLDDRVRLSNVIDTYTPVVAEFHEWLATRMGEEHADALEELRDIERRKWAVEQEWQAAWDDAEDERQQEADERESPDESATSSAAVAASEDFAPTVDTLIARFYESISFSRGKQPNWDHLRALFVRDAQIVEIKSDGLKIWNKDDYISDLRRTVNEGSVAEISEVEIARRSIPCGDIAHVLSTYETRFAGESGRIQVVRGINSFHLAKAGHNRWGITSLHYFDENSETPIPAEFLP